MIQEETSVFRKVIVCHCERKFSINMRQIPNSYTDKIYKQKAMRVVIKSEDY